MKRELEDQTEQAPSATPGRRRAYEPPAISEEEVFERIALQGCTQFDASCEEAPGPTS